MTKFKNEASFKKNKMYLRFEQLIFIWIKFGITRQEKSYFIRKIKLEFYKTGGFETKYQVGLLQDKYFRSKISWFDEKAQLVIQQDSNGAL